MTAFLFRVILGIVAPVLVSFIRSFAEKVREDVEQGRGESEFTPQSVGDNLAKYAYDLVRVAEDRIQGGDAKHAYVFANLEVYAKTLGYQLSVAALDRLIIGALAKFQVEAKS